MTAEREFRYGDYLPGRWIWKTTNLIPFDQPIPAKGAQGWWNYDPERLNTYRGQLHLFG